MHKATVADLTVHSNPKRVLIVGAGSIGLRHLQNVRKLYPTATIVMWSTSLRNKTIDPIYSAADRVVFDLKSALVSEPEVAIVASPTAYHLDISLALASQGLDLLIEKPISDKLDGLDKLYRITQENDLIVMVGYNFRFYKPLQLLRNAVAEGEVGRVLSINAQVGQYLPHWRLRDYRETVSAQRVLGGGVVLELSHELDYVRWVVGEVESVFAHVGHLSDLEIDVEDTANIFLKFRNGSFGNIHLNMVQKAPSRTCKVIGVDGVIDWNGIDHSVEIYRATTGVRECLNNSAQESGNPMYERELCHFFKCVADRKQPTVGIDDGIRVLEVALAAKSSSETGRMVSV